jgi:hypothetical protein
MGKPAPCVSAFIEAVESASRTPQPHHAMAATQRAWRALCVTAVLVTNAGGGARFERTRLGLYALALLSWMWRHRKIPWDPLLVASVRGMLHHQGLTSGRLVVDDTAHQRAPSAQALAHLDPRRDRASGGSRWGQSLVVLVWGTAQISLPVGFVFSQPAPERSAWYKKDNSLRKLGGPKAQRPCQPAPTPRSRTQPPLALLFLEAFKAHHPAIQGSGSTAAALDATAPWVDGASARCGGVPVIAPIRSNQHLRIGQREPPVADYFASHPGTPHRLRLRGGAAVVATVGSARLSICSHHTKRLIVAIQ